MKTVLVISFSDLASDPRVNRQIRFLRAHYHVIAAGLAEPRVPGVEFRPIAREARGRVGRAVSAALLIGGRFERYYWRQRHIQGALRRLGPVRPDLVLANDIETLPLALRLAGRAKVVFDAHEYAPAQFEDRLRFRLFFQRLQTYLCRRYIPRADAMMTVSPGLAAAYERETGVRPLVVTNAPDYERLDPSPVGAGRGRVRLVHHGLAKPSRRIEDLIEVMAHLDERFELDLVLVPRSAAYMQKLERSAAGDPRIRFVDPVPMRELPRFLNRYDVGLCYFAPTTFNLLHALPNKFFEFIQARLAVAVGPSPDMAQIVSRHDCGVVAREFSPRSLARSLMDCDAERIAHYKRRADAIAERFSAAHNAQTVTRVVADLLDDGDDHHPGERKSTRAGSAHERT